MDAISKKIKFYLGLFLFSLLVSCANQLPPGGGEIDTTPPEITEAFPINGTVNFEENYFRVWFSEYVDKRSFRDAIFISPAIEGELEISWTGRRATVTFPKGLRDDFTYVVTIGTDVVDLNNRNRMAQSYIFSFATGSQIDTRSITGKVFDKDADGVMIFAYRVSNDTIDYLKSKPDYISQVGKDGTFNLNGLAEDNYRIFAVKDQLRDLLFQSEMDKIGMPYSDINLTGKDSTYSGLNFFLMSADTTKPRLISAVMTDQRHILVTTSRPVDSTIISSTNFSIIDSTENVELSILYAFKGNTKPEEFVLITEKALLSLNNYFLRADRLQDMAGNLYMDDYTPITISEREDTSAVKVFKTFPTDLTKIDFKNPVIRFYFDDAIRKDNVNRAFTFSDTLGTKVQFTYKFTDDATIQLTPNADLRQDKDYLIDINFNLIIDASGNLRDTNIVYKLRTISGLEFTGASGRVNTDSFEDMIVIIENTESKEKHYKTKVNSSGLFEFDRIESGKYMLWAFYDTNQNGKYDFGYPSPLEYAERFFVHKDTLELRPRWSVTDILFEIKK